MDYSGKLLQLFLIFSSYLYPYHVKNQTPPKAVCISHVSLGYAAITNMPQNLSIIHKGLVIVHAKSFRGLVASNGCHRDSGYFYLVTMSTGTFHIQVTASEKERAEEPHTSS